MVTPGILPPATLVPPWTSLVDSHCHLDRVSLAPYGGDFQQFLAATRAAGVGRMLCVSIDLEQYPAMARLVEGEEDIFLSVGVHPNEESVESPEPERLAELAQHPRNVAIGESGLDYYHGKGDLGWQHERFRRHIRAARLCGKPLIVHTRDAREDTLRILREERAEEAGGVMHCFTENWEMASQALDLGFYISFSGIITFRNADELRAVAARVPQERLLIETDSPYLAPVPFRGKPNEPRHLAHIAEALAQLHGMTVDDMARLTADNFTRLFLSGR